MIEMTSFGTVVIAVFGAVFCLMQTRFGRLRRSFATFLATVALNNLPDAFAALIEVLPGGYVSIFSFATWPSSFFLAPLFWIYVCVLTSTDQLRPKKLTRHFLLPGVTVVIAILVLASPAAVRDSLYSGNLNQDAPWQMTLAVLLGVMHLFVYPQIAFYLVLILRRLMRFRLKLRDFYASTEQHELRWIYVIGGLAIFFWLAQTLFLIAEVDLWDGPVGIMTASLSGFVLVAAMTLWGLRQRPPLEPQDDDDPSPLAPASAQTIPEEMVSDQPAADVRQTASKYERSALSQEASERLSRKLRCAMEVDHLHRNPNLSLWALAKHTGASSNYISQTLNEMIGESFFDFVNGYRVAEAKTLLSTTNESVLNIAYDVGFNARSSFYNAFKRATGQTPTSYRKKMSQRDGLDDIGGPSGDS